MKVRPYDIPTDTKHLTCHKSLLETGVLGSVEYFNEAEQRSEGSKCTTAVESKMMLHVTPAFPRRS